MKPPPVREEVLAFHNSQIVVDLHLDSILQQRLFRYDIKKRHSPWMRRQPLFWHADIPRMVEGGYTAAVCGIHYWPWESRRAFPEVKKQLDYLERVVETDERVVSARTAEEIEAAKREGKLALMAGFEGAHLLSGQIEHVEEFRQRKGLYLTLAHFSRNSATVPALGRGADPDQGLTPFGRELVQTLNAVGMIADVAHLNERTVLEVCELSTAPVIASHTIARALHDHRRGVTDRAIEAITATGGVIGIMFCPSFLTGKLNTSLAAVAEHIEHVADVGGPGCVAIGTDLDGWISTIPNDIRDCRDLPYLTQLLLDRGFTQEQTGLVLGGNALRVIRSVRGS
ncbi:MAG: dipeptidase [Bradymonadales bacterium]|nr:dipeptidase [Bradymonadales bacterium]